MASDLSGRRAMVVGAEFPVGGAIALALAEAGADVAVAALQADESVLTSRKVKRTIEAMGRRSAEYVMDVMLGRNVQVTTRQIAKEMGGLDIEVSAGEFPLEVSIEKISETDLARVVAMNFSAHLFVLRSAVGEFARNEPIEGVRGVMTIVTPNHEGRPGLAAVASAQAGARQLVHEAAAEFADAGIRVNGIVAGAGTEDSVREAALEMTSGGVTGEIRDVR